MGGETQIPLTVFVIAQDEEANIGDCLLSADFAAELLVLDGGSRDRTREIAAGLGARVEQRPFDGMNSQKNAALALTTQPWALNLDADERISPELRASILELFRGKDGVGVDPPCNGYFVPRRAHYLGKWIRGGGWYPDHKLRLFRRELGRFGGRDPHDKVIVTGRLGRLQGDILHYAYRSFAEHERKLDRYSSAAAYAALEDGRRFALLRMLFTPPLRFLKAFVLRGGFRDGKTGILLAWMAARYEWQRYRKLWALQRAAIARK